MSPDRQRALRAFVARGSGLANNRVILANQDAPRPEDPYATVLLASDRQVGYSDSLSRCDADDLTEAHVYEEWEAVLSVQFFRDGAHVRAQRFLAWVDTPEGLLYEERMGLTPPATDADPWGPRTFPRMVIQKPVTYRRVDEILAEAWEERTNVDLTVRYGVVTEQSTGRIDEVPVTVQGVTVTAGAP